MMSTPDEKKVIENEKEQPVVAKVVDDYRVAITLGQQDDIKVGQRFLLYGLSDEEISHPVTNEKLGYLEIPKGSGTVISVQDKMAIIESDRYDRPKGKIVKKTKNPFFYGVETIEEPIESRQLTFEDPEPGDRVRPV